MILSIRNTKVMNVKALDQLISFLCELLESFNPESTCHEYNTGLTELDLGGLGGSTEQGEDVLGAIFQTSKTIKRLDISENPAWAQGDRYQQIFRELTSTLVNLESINVSYNYNKVD